MPLTIYYDDQCGLCGNWIRLLQKYGSLKEVNYVGLSQASGEVQSISQSHNSWVIGRGTEHFLGYAGFVECMKESRFFRWFGYIGNFYPVKLIGDLVYKFVSSQRKTCRIRHQQQK